MGFGLLSLIVAAAFIIGQGDIKRLLMNVPPGMMKSRLTSVLWPAWEWTHSPALRYWTASYDISLSKEMAMYSRDLMLTDWYQERWGHGFRFRKTGEDFFVNDQGGHRLSTSPESKGTGKHGDRLMFDDPLNAADANRISKAVVESTNDWYSTVTATRGQTHYAEIIVMQRLHENDMAAHALSFGEWEVLCLPEEYWSGHPYAWRGDPRTQEGELLWPRKRPAEEHAILVAKLGKRHTASQLQQHPTTREGSIILREDWRYFPPEHLDAAEEGDVSKLPKFRSIVCAWDTSLKDLNDSDFVAGGVWGIAGGNRYLLKTFHNRASLSSTITAVLELRAWALKRWPKLPIRVLIEKQSNGPTVISRIKKKVPGVIPVLTDTDKVLRAEAAEPDFNSHSVWVPGAAKGDFSDYDPSGTPSWVQDVIEECANFPLGKNDDLVDMVTMALNWARTKTQSGSRTVSATRTATSDVLRERSRIRTSQRNRRGGVGVYRSR